MLGLLLGPADWQFEYRSPICSRRCATASNPPLSAWRAQTGATSGVKAEAAKRGRDSASLDGLTPVRFTVIRQQATPDLVRPNLIRASVAMRRDRQSSG